MANPADPLLDAVEDYVARSLMPLARKVVELEVQLQNGTPAAGPPGSPGAPGPAGPPGKDADADDLLERFSHAVELKFLGSNAA